MDKYIFNACKCLLSIPKSKHFFLLNHYEKCISVILPFTNNISLLRDQNEMIFLETKI